MEAVCYLTELNVKHHDTAWKVRQAVETAQSTLYRFDQMKSKKDTERRPLRKLVFSVSSRRELTDGEQALEVGLAIAQGVELTKNLGNMPANICTPAYLADQAK